MGHRQVTVSACNQKPTVPTSTQLLRELGKMSTVSVSGLRSNKTATMDVDTLAAYTGGHNWLGPNADLICIRQLHRLNSCIDITSSSSS